MDALYYGAFMSGFFSQPHKKFPEYKKFAPKHANKPVEKVSEKVILDSYRNFVLSAGGRIIDGAAIH